MNPQELEQLRKLGATIQTPSGSEAVAVTVMVQEEMPALSRAERKQWVAEKLATAQNQLQACGGYLNESSISPSGQLAEAAIPVENYSEVVKALEESHYRVDQPRFLKVTT